MTAYSWFIEITANMYIWFFSFHFSFFRFSFFSTFHFILVIIDEIFKPGAVRPELTPGNYEIIVLYNYMVM